MSRKPFPSKTDAFPRDPGMGRMLLLSLGLHLLVVVLFAGFLAPRFQRELRPIYYVDLVNLPVADPQAGRPDARPEAKQPEPAPPRPAPPPPRPEPPKPAPKAAAKPAPAPAPPITRDPAKPAQKPDPKAAEQALQESLRRMQARRDEDELKDTFNQLAKRDTRNSGAAVKAPVGEQTGKGTEVGIHHQTWLQTHLKEQWSYSPYLSNRLDLEASFVLHFDDRGHLRFYTLEQGSGNQQFDESVVRAIVKLFKDQALPNPPRKGIEIPITFNLKDLKRE